MTEDNNIPSSKHKILALIPAYNEATRIEPVIAGALHNLPVLVIDDGSSDSTVAVSQAAGATVLPQKPNQGKGAALRAGFHWALDHEFEAVLALDADGQHDPDEIPIFLKAYGEGKADLIIGKRQFKDMPPVRRLANTLGEKTFSWAIGRDVLDNQSGYRLISRRLMMDLLDGDEAGFEFELEMIVVAVRHGYALDWVPIRTIYAGESSHINPVHHLTNFLRVAWKTRRSIKTP